MSMKYLGERFDIHCGGIDAIPVHHTNEIAQSEAATGGPWVTYWLHGAFLVVGKEKMAKSAGNLVPLHALIDKGYDPLDFRYFCFGAHYRSPLNYSYTALDAARSGRLGLLERIALLKTQAADVPQEPSGRAREYLEAFETHAAEDLDMPKCLADLWTLLRDPSVESGQKLSAAFRMDRILDLDLSSAGEGEPELEEEMRCLVEEREKARRNRNWRRADEIREMLKARGILLEDERNGTKVRFAAGARKKEAYPEGPSSKEEKSVTSDKDCC
jgi:cysteinyl-tRNA synthetase